jgi:Fungal protein kinase
MLGKPDISVIDQETQHDVMKTQEECLHWCRIYCIIEVTSKKSSVKDLLCQISQKVACIFNMQPQRKFVCRLAILGESTTLEYIFALVDRASMTHTLCTPIISYEAFTLLRIVFAFCFAKPETISWDPSMTVDPETYEATSIAIMASDNEKPTSNITMHTFNIIKLIHSSPILYSCETRVWIVKDQQGDFYMLKDSWILEASTVTEIQLIRHIEKTIKQDLNGYLFQSNCPSYIIGQDCVCLTDTICGLLSNKPAAHHRRHIITTTIGDPLISFHSKKEFVSVFLDIVNSMFLN